MREVDRFSLTAYHKIICNRRQPAYINSNKITVNTCGMKYFDVWPISLNEKDAYHGYKKHKCIVYSPVTLS